MSKKDLETTHTGQDHCLVFSLGNIGNFFHLYYYSTRSTVIFYFLAQKLGTVQSFYLKADL